jgi:hypothetical protein
MGELIVDEVTGDCWFVEGDVVIDGQTGELWIVEDSWTLPDAPPSWYDEPIEPEAGDELVPLADPDDDYDFVSHYDFSVDSPYTGTDYLSF